MVYCALYNCILRSTAGIVGFSQRGVIAHIQSTFSLFCMMLLSQYFWFLFWFFLQEMITNEHWQDHAYILTNKAAPSLNYASWTRIRLSLIFLHWCISKLPYHSDALRPYVRHQYKCVHLQAIVYTYRGIHRGWWNRPPTHTQGTKITYQTMGCMPYIVWQWSSTIVARSNTGSSLSRAQGTLGTPLYTYVHLTYPETEIFWS